MQLTALDVQQLAEALLALNAAYEAVRKIAELETNNYQPARASTSARGRLTTERGEDGRT